MLALAFEDLLGCVEARRLLDEPRRQTQRPFGIKPAPAWAMGERQAFFFSCKNHCVVARHCPPAQDRKADTALFAGARP